jgi:hypothetical protein
LLSRQNQCEVTAIELDDSAIEKLGEFCKRVIKIDLTRRTGVTHYPMTDHSSQLSSLTFWNISLIRGRPLPRQEACWRGMEN